MIMMTCLIAILLICWVCMTRWPLAVLLFSLPAACVFFIAGLASEHAGVILLSPGLFLSCSIYVGFFLLSGDHAVARTAARQLLAGLMLFAVALLVGLIFGPLAMVGVLMFAVWLAAMIAYGSTARRSMLFSILTTLKTCMTQNLPLPMALECAAQGRSDQEATVYRQIKTHLVKGYSLVHAMRLAWPQCPGHVTGLLQGAEHAGSLATGLAAVHKNVALKERRRQACEPVHPVYPAMVLVVLLVIVTALFQFVIPQFAVTLHEMAGADLPLITQWLLIVCLEWAPPVMGVLGVGFGLWMIVVIAGWLNKGKRPAWIVNVMDWFRWHIPFVHRFDRMFALIQLLETLNLGLRAGCPLDQAVFQCLELDVNRCFTRRIRTWHRLIAQGQSASSAALKSGLPRAVAWAFDTTVNQGNTPNILSMLEQTYSDRYVYQSNILSLILGPCIIMMLGAMVCFVMLGVFLPMIYTITSLTQIYP